MPGDGVDRAGQRIRFADVARHGEHVGTGGGERAAQIVERVPAAGQQAEAGAVVGEHPGEVAADTAAGAGHHHHPVGERRAGRGDDRLARTGGHAAPPGDVGRARARSSSASRVSAVSGR
ncbi:hypothetical protein Prubr_58590 [Polymorphospora rubra]|uniref:Uncharacterized protein n=1 Tax=Polymorphospora rubra TaxID=338584 RepID=A0A810NAI6_9ACTN|nr:hypothetical protein Prubr_58590 [Polymorphospora rubra]